MAQPRRKPAQQKPEQSKPEQFGNETAKLWIENMDVTEQNHAMYTLLSRLIEHRNAQIKTLQDSIAPLRHLQK